MNAPIEVEEPELQRLLPPWTFNDEAAYNEACARNHRWLRERMQLVLHGPDAPVMRSQKPEDEFKPIHKVPRKNASGAGRPPRPMALTLDQVRDLVLKGRTSSQIAAVAGCKVGIIQKMRMRLKIARPCPDCLQPTGRGLTATYCIGCAAKHDKHGRTRQACGHAGCTHLHHARGYCRAHQAEAPKPPRAQEAPCN